MGATDSTSLVWLTDRELVLLDGKVSEKTQFEVDAAKARLVAQDRLADVDPNIASFVADVITEAKTNGELTCRHQRIPHCPVCGKSGGYKLRTRSSMRGRKGTPDHDKPIFLSAIEVAKRFVSFQNRVTVGACTECWNKAKPLIVQELEGIEAEISEHITGHPPKFKKWDNRKCTACGWTGHEGEMRELEAVMGGKYRGGCPNCPAENKLFNSGKFEVRPGFTIVPA